MRSCRRCAQALWCLPIDISIRPLRAQSPEELAARVLASGRGFDYWESGMDLGLGNDYYDSFVAYQKLLLKEFERMSGEYGFDVINASRPVKRVATGLQKSISQ